MAKLADKYAIGTEHVIDGKTVIVEEAVPHRLCKDCAFYFEIGTVTACNLPLLLKGRTPYHYAVCFDSERSDGKHIIFRRKEQQ